MNKQYKGILPIATVAALMYAGVASAEIGVSADIELDTDIVDVDDKNYSQGGRVRAVFFGEHKSGDNFVRGRAEGLFKKSGAADTDDAYIQLGSSFWDLQAGRFEAWDLGPLAKDTIVTESYGGIAHYRGNATRGRAADDIGQFALHIFPSKTVGVELATFWGETGSPVDEEVFSRARLMVRLDLGMMTLGVGAETDRTTALGGEGFAATAGFKFGDVAINVNAGKVESDDTSTTQFDSTSIGANATIGPFCIGAYVTEDDDAAAEKLRTLYANYTFENLLGVKNASFTLGVDHASLSEDTVAEDRLQIRGRFNYTFF
ncbi:MAG TPA: carbohydrate porin [Burkholderiales bacterium]|nr:carbohydrate porin [Burkholderiales bacterium]